MIRFIAIDPSSTASGWAVFEDQGLVAWGTIETLKVQYAWRGRNLSALRVVFIAIQKWAKSVGLPFAAYNVATWKNAVVGHVHASKETTKENACYRFPRLPRDLSEHEYDAIAIGVYHSGVRYLEALAKGGSS